MKISSTNIGASTYSMKKAMEMPNLVLNLVQQTADLDKHSLSTKSTAAAHPIGLDAVKDKGNIIDLIA